MNKFLFSAIIISFLPATKIVASDTIKVKKGLFLSISAAYTNNRVYGSMVKRNDEFGENVKMENREGFMVSVSLERALPGNAFYRGGLGLIKKQVNPMVNTYAVYQDELETLYLTVPLEVGVYVLDHGKPFNIGFSIGSSANLKLSDNSITGPDRAGFKTPAFTASLLAGANISGQISHRAKLFAQYMYIRDLTNSYVETLYWSSDEPRKDFIYKYKTNALSAGIKWLIQ